MTEEKRKLLKKLAKLREERPPGYNHECRRIVTQLRRLDDPFRVLEKRGSEQTGRHQRSTSCPDFDRMDSDSRP
jgi:hypothetical protein